MDKVLLSLSIQREKRQWPRRRKLIFLSHLLEIGTWPLDLWMLLHSAPFTLFHPCFSLSKPQLILKLNWLFHHQWTSSLHLPSPVLLPSSFHISSGFCYFSYICFEGFSNKVFRRSFLRVFHYKFFLVSWLKVLLRRTWVTYARAGLKQVDFRSK